MTIDEMEFQLNWITAGAKDKDKEALEMVQKRLKQFDALTNRCRVLSNGTLCLFCPIECNNRKDKYRGDMV